MPPPTTNEELSNWDYPKQREKAGFPSPSATLPELRQRSNPKTKARPLSSTLHTTSHYTESQWSPNFNKRQQWAYALPHHSLAYFLAAIVQRLLHFPPSAGCAPFAHSSPLKSQSSDPSEPVKWSLLLLPKVLNIRKRPLVQSSVRPMAPLYVCGSRRRNIQWCVHWGKIWRIQETIDGSSLGDTNWKVGGMEDYTFCVVSFLFYVNFPSNVHGLH